MVEKARDKRKTETFKLGGNVYAFDSTTVDLCLNVFWWAKFRKRKGNIKIHTLYDIETQIIRKHSIFHRNPLVTQNYYYFRGLWSQSIDTVY